MRGDYNYAIWRAPGSLVTVEHWKKGEQLWSLVTVRKDHKCCVVGDAISKGSQAFRPVTDADNRMDRISMAGMIKLAGEING